jgi:Mg2+ and Co2+ transporter CorA
MREMSNTGEIYDRSLSMMTEIAHLKNELNSLHELIDKLSNGTTSRDLPIGVRLNKLLSADPDYIKIK